MENQPKLLQSKIVDNYNLYLAWQPLGLNSGTRIKIIKWLLADSFVFLLIQIQLNCTIG